MPEADGCALDDRGALDVYPRSGGYGSLYDERAL